MRPGTGTFCFVVIILNLNLKEKHATAIYISVYGTTLLYMLTFCCRIAVNLVEASKNFKNVALTVGK